MNSKLMPSISRHRKQQQLRHWSVVVISFLKHQTLRDGPSSVFTEHFLSGTAHLLRSVFVPSVLTDVDVDDFRFTLDVTIDDGQEVKLRTLLLLDVVPKLLECFPVQRNAKNSGRGEVETMREEEFSDFWSKDICVNRLELGCHSVLGLVVRVQQHVMFLVDDEKVAALVKHLESLLILLLLVES